VATEEESVDDPAADELNGSFFDVKWKEFADEEEEYLPDVAFGWTACPGKGGKKNVRQTVPFHQKQQGWVEADSELGRRGSCVPSWTTDRKYRRTIEYLH
jgi:hypothetical protein